MAARAFELELLDDVELHASCVDAVEAFRERRVSFVMFHLSRRRCDDGQTALRIKPDSDDSGGIGFDGESYSEFCARLPPRDCRLCLVWFHQGARGEYDLDRATPIFVTWCPDIEAEEGEELNEYFADCMALNMNKYLLRKKGRYELEVKASCLEELEPREVSEQLAEGRPPTAVSGIFRDEEDAISV